MPNRGKSNGRHGKKQIFSMNICNTSMSLHLKFNSVLLCPLLFTVTKLLATLLKYIKMKNTNKHILAQKENFLETVYVEARLVE